MSSMLPIPLLMSLASTVLLSAPMSSLSDCTCKWDHAAFVFVHLALYWVVLYGLLGKCLLISEYMCINMWHFSWDRLHWQSLVTIRVHSGLWTASQSDTIIILSLMAQTNTARITRRGYLLLSLPHQHDSSLSNCWRMPMSTKNCICGRGQNISERCLWFRIHLKDFNFQALGVSGALLSLGLFSVCITLGDLVLAFH